VSPQQANTLGAAVIGRCGGLVAKTRTCDFRNPTRSTPDVWNLTDLEILAIEFRRGCGFL